MGYYEWESGQIRLPAAEFAEVRRAMQEASNRFREQVLERVQDFWASLTDEERTSVSAYEDRLHQMLVDRNRRRMPHDHVMEAAEHVLRNMAKTETSARRAGRFVSDIIPEANTRTLTFPIFGYGQGEVEMDRADNTVIVRADGKHLEDYFWTGPLPKALLRALDRVTWTRGSGGYTLANNEYNIEEGDGQEFVRRAWGPRGMKEDPRMTEPFYRTDGTYVSRRHLDSM